MNGLCKINGTMPEMVFDHLSIWNVSCFEK